MTLLGIQMASETIQQRDPKRQKGAIKNEGDVDAKVKDQFVFLVLDHKDEFQPIFDRWYDQLKRTTTTNGAYAFIRKQGSICLVLNQNAGDLPRGKNTKLFITGDQVKLAEWVNCFWGVRSNAVSKCRMKLTQFVLLGTHLAEIEYLFRGTHSVRAMFTCGKREGYDCSHLCNSQEDCIEGDHLVCDPYWVNREARRVCPGPDQCRCSTLDHRLAEAPFIQRYKCLAPGQLYVHWRDLYPSRQNPPHE